jgi:toxin ParE1/3/4
MSNYRVLRHPDVAADLMDIIGLIAEFAGTDVAVRKLEEMETTLRGLAQTPHIGTMRHDIFPNLRAIPTARKGVVSFIVDDDAKEVLVISITYAGADWISRTRKRR